MLSYTLAIIFLVLGVFATIFYNYENSLHPVLQRNLGFGMIVVMAVAAFLVIATTGHNLLLGLLVGGINAMFPMGWWMSRRSEEERRLAEAYNQALYGVERHRFDVTTRP